MPFFHGVRHTLVSNAPAPNVVNCSIPFAIGTAPVHTVSNSPVNRPVLVNSYDEAVAAFGYSDDWAKFTLCEVIYSHFKLYKMKPLILCNVLDPSSMTAIVAEAEKSVSNHQIMLPIEALKTGLTVKDNTTSLVLDTDYTLFYSGDNLVIELKPTSTYYSSTALTVGYNTVDSTEVTATEIIGGVDTNTGAVTGLSTIKRCMHYTGKVPDLILAPGYSETATVAAAMALAAAGINGIFPAKALVDLDCTTTTLYSGVSAAKTAAAVIDKRQIACWPRVKNGALTFHMSTHVAGIMAQVDSKNSDCPYESPSNKPILADALVDGLGNEVILDLEAANELNAAGVVTAIRFVNGWTLWGNYTACYGQTGATVQDYFISVSRMFDWVGNTFIRSFWEKCDNPMNKVLVESIIDTANVWLNGLVAEQKLLGAQIEYRDEDNSLADLMAGIIRFHVVMTPPSPAQEIEFILEYNAEYVAQALSA